MKFKDLFFAFNELSPATMIEIYINHERVLMKAGEAAYPAPSTSKLYKKSKTCTKYIAIKKLWYTKDG